MNKARSILVVSGIVIGAVLIWQQQLIWHLQKERVDLLDHAAIQRAAQAQNPTPPDGQTDPGELARLRGEQSELMRLRNQVAQLRRQAKELAAKSATTAKDVATPNGQDAMPFPAIDTFVASNHVTLAWKMGLVTGGWNTDPGKRTFFFIQPEPKLSESGEQTQVLISGRVIEIPEEKLANLGLESVMTDTRPGAHQEVYPAEPYQALLKALEQTQGVNIVSSPRIQTSDGVPATLHVGSTLELPNGEQYPIGTTISLSPTLLPGGSGVVLSVSSEIRKPTSGASTTR